MDKTHTLHLPLQPLPGKKTEDELKKIRGHVNRRDARVAAHLSKNVSR